MDPLTKALFTATAYLFGVVLSTFTIVVSIVNLFAEDGDGAILSGVCAAVTALVWCWWVVLSIYSLARVVQLSKH